MHEMVRYRALGILGACIAAACSSGGDTPAPGLMQAWRVESITPIGQPVAAGDTAVVYGTVNRDLYLYGVSVADGTIRWRQSASPSLTTSGIRLTLAVLDGRVAYFRPDPSANLAARLVIASPDTGGDLLVSDAYFFRSHPALCFDERDVCVSTADGRTAVSRRFSLDAGRAVPDRGSPPPNSRFLGRDLLDLGERPEVLAGFQGGSVRWRSPISRLFSAGYGSDQGWYFELYKAPGLHVGSVGHPSDRRDPKTVVRDLTKFQMAAIDAATGASAWRDDGSSFACDAKIALERTPGELWPVRCRYRGVARYDVATSAATYEDLDVVIEGFDVRTGATTWSVPLGAAEGFMKEDVKAAVVSESEVLVQGAAGPMVLDLAGGSTRTPGMEDAFWCAKNALFDYREPRYLTTGGTSNSWRGGALLETCAVDGSPTTAVPGQLAKSLGATFGDRTVLAVARGLVAYDRNGRGATA